MIFDIKIEKLECDVSLGVYSAEKLAKQKVSFNIIVQCEYRLEDIKLDDISFVVDYDKLAAITRDICSSRHFNLIENLATEVVTKIKIGFESIRKVEVEVSKYGAVKKSSSVSAKLSSTR